MKGENVCEGNWHSPFFESGRGYKSEQRASFFDSRKEHPEKAAEKRRDPFFDNMKGILIFLVVLGHGVSSFDVIGGAGYDWLYQAIFSFHMPAFLFVSGYFASPKPKKTIARLLPLYLIFQLIQCLMLFWESWLDNPRTAELDLQFSEPGWTLWYLMVLMIFSLVLPLLDTESRRKQLRNLIIALALGVLVGYNLQSVLDFAAIGRTATFLVFFLAGYYLKKNRELFADLTGPDRFCAFGSGHGLRRTFAAGDPARFRSFGSGHGSRRTFAAADPVRMKERCIRIARIAAAAGAAVYLLLLALPQCPIWGKMFYGDQSYLSTGMTAGWKLAAYGISFLWIAVLLLWVPRRKIPLLRKLGRNTLGVYLFHTILLRMLRMWEPADAVLNVHFGLVVLLCVGLTLLFSMDCFSDLLKKIQNLHQLQLRKKAAGASDQRITMSGKY